MPRKQFLFLNIIYFTVAMSFWALSCTKKEESAVVHPPSTFTGEGTEKKKKEHKIIYYRNPMRSDIISKVPAKDEMGMEYIPVYEDEVNEEEISALSPSEGVEGRSGVKLTNEGRQLIGVTHEKIGNQELNKEIQVTGRVAFDPDLFSAVEEYRQSLLLGGSSGRSLIESSKTKLRLMGLSDAKIKSLSQSGQSVDELLLPKGKVWIFAEVFEYEVGGIKAGQKIEATTPSLPGEKFSGKVTSVSSVLNAPTRTVRVQAEVPDPKKKLRPDNFLNVKLIIELGRSLALPVSAVLFSNQEAFVFVISEKGQYEPRKVVLGDKAGDFYPVVSGLIEGEDVVTSANFLIDSESQLRSVLKKATTQGDGK